MYNGIPKVYHHILEKNDNDKCADCKSERISHVNSHFQVILCSKCSEVHKCLPPTYLNTQKSLKAHDQWNCSSGIAPLELINNRASDDDLLKAVPFHYSPLTHDSLPIWRKYFISAKYVERRFTYKGKFVSNFSKPLVKEGPLWKRGEKDDRYREYNFVLQENECLVYFHGNEKDDEPKQTISIDKLDLYLAPDKMKKENGLQLSSYDNNSIIDIYVYSAFPFEIIDWYYLIRAAKLERLKLCYPFEEAETLLKFISGKIIKEGYMNKSGEMTTDILRKRWFTLIEKHLMERTMWWLRYYENPFDSKPKGEIFIGKISDGYQIDLDSTFTGRKSDDKTFTLVTKDRSYDLVADSLEEKESWISYLNIALSRES